VLGDALLDRDVDGRVERLCPDAPAPVVDDPVQRARPGGAGLAAALAAGEGRAVRLVTALSGDAAGRELGALLAEASVDALDLGLAGPGPEKVRVRAGGRTLVRIDRGGGRSPVRPPGPAALEAVRSASAVLVADYGRGVAGRPELRSALEARAGEIPVVWDPHPRGPEPVAGVTVATPNAREAAGFAGDGAGGDLALQARLLRARWRARAVCVTRGPAGALLLDAGDDLRAVRTPAVTGGDACGAGDAFASALAGALADGASVPEAVEAAVERAAAWVAAGGAAAWRPVPAARVDPAPTDEAEAVVARTRARGGTVVATGGCFDLLHAGHVSVLQAARALGDCLVVCVNSDESVRRLKGSDRPLVPEEDRAAVLHAVGCVDAVVVFDEDTPERALARLKPDVWAKGGDYAVAELPEARLVASWGGRTEILPYVAGRSTTRLIEEVALRASS
jgi:rfaE bifunctional protein nucleotidyltransferase chain/domain